MKRIISIFLICLVLLIYLPQLAFANSPGPNLDGTSNRSPTWLFNVLVIYLLIVGFTCLIEWLVSIPFGMHKECAKVILITNIITQLVMHFLEFLFLMLTASTGGVLYWVTVPLFVVGLEIVVYVSEYFIYHNKMLGFPTWSILLYTICANTASLVLGVLIIF